MKSKALAAWACAAALWGIGLPAHAIRAYTSDHFTGNCIDCAAAGGVSSYTTNAALNLWVPYVFGAPITTSDFLSFTYEGSNLLNAYTINASQLSSISGYIAQDGTANLSLQWASGYFDVTASGSWNTCNGTTVCATVPADYGNQGSFGATPPAGVPEPASIALAGLALAGLAAARRRR